MGVTLTVGGARATFQAAFAADVVKVLDNAFGAENDWEAITSRRFGQIDESHWAEFQERARATLGKDNIPNLMGIWSDGRSVAIPMHVHQVSLPLHADKTLGCVSLHGLRRELVELAERWELPLDDQGLTDLLDVASDPDDGWVSDSCEVQVFARVAMAANEAVRRDCPLWFLGWLDADVLPETLEPATVRV